MSRSDETMTPTVPADWVLELCHEQGFVLAGVAAAEASGRASEQDAWFADGRHGSMAWMERHVEIRKDVRRIIDGARSVICVADRYSLGEKDDVPAGFGRVARYARGRDYHVVMKRRLHAVCDALASKEPEHVFRACVDSAPIHERELAESAGLGSIGKHTLLIAPGTGSWILLGAIVTSLPLQPTRAPDLPPDDPCGTCTRCIDACPTDAIEPWSIDAGRCISEMTIERRGMVDPGLHADVGDWLFGCDVCQEVCPHNAMTTRNQAIQVHQAYANPPTADVEGRTPDASAFDLATVMEWGPAERSEAFTSSAMKRANLEMMRRNAVIAAGNASSQGDVGANLVSKIESIASDEGEADLVRSTAVDVLADRQG